MGIYTITFTTITTTIAIIIVIIINMILVIRLIITLNLLFAAFYFTQRAMYCSLLHVKTTLD